MIASLVSSNFPEIKHTHLWCCFLMFIYFYLITKYLFIFIYLFIYLFLFIYFFRADSMTLSPYLRRGLSIGTVCVVVGYVFLVSSIYKSTAIRGFHDTHAQEKLYLEIH